MARAGHLRSLSSLNRTDLEFLLLLTAGWDQIDLRPRRLAARRVAVIDHSVDDELDVALHVAAQAASVQLVRVPPALARDSERAAPIIGPVMDALLLADPLGVNEEWYEQSHLPVFNLMGPSGAPLDVVGQLHGHLVGGGAIHRMRVTWNGPAAPALRSWVEATSGLAITVTQVAHGSDIDRQLLAQLEAEGQQGRFECVSEAPAESDLDARRPLDLRTRACVIAAVLEFGLHVA